MIYRRQPAKRYRSAVPGVPGGPYEISPGYNQKDEDEFDKKVL
jgi:hypothetical protein